ncbi:MAG: sigma-70 family RNA polymerase sigma factor [Ruminococcaceae bacterium]|nr:sigma-70 family RNA polymerase sigma factor [Oscillospiraceae bacterium]
MCNREFIKLIEEYQNHKTENFNLIYNEFYKLLLLYGSRIGDSDATQELSVFLVELLFKIDISKFKKDDSEDIKKYIAVCLRNEYYAILKRKHSRLNLYCELNCDIPEAEDDIESELFIRQCLQQVNDTQRKILILRYLCDFSDSQIAEKLHISRQAVNKARNKGLETLKNFLSR